MFIFFPNRFWNLLNWCFSIILDRKFLYYELQTFPDMMVSFFIIFLFITVPVSFCANLLLLFLVFFLFFRFAFLFFSFLYFLLYSLFTFPIFISIGLSFLSRFLIIFELFSFYLFVIMFFSLISYWTSCYHLIIHAKKLFPIQKIIFIKFSAFNKSSLSVLEIASFRRVISLSV